VKKRILILGGTQFIGRNLVNRLIEHDDFDITLFNRQITQAHLFPDLNKIKGDRETSDTKLITNVDWDYIIDLSCFYPESLENILNCVTGNLNKYILLSSCSAYNNENTKSILKDESAETLPCDSNQRIDTTPATYGNRKAECERILQKSGVNHVILRPALVYGKYDHTDRFYYWLHQVKKSDELLLPNAGENKLSITYVDDLVETILQSLEITSNQIFNVVSVPEASIGDIVNSTRLVLEEKSKTLINASTKFLNANNISQWADMPLWIDGDYFTFSNEKLKQELGIKPINLMDSINEIIPFYDDLGWSSPKYGMDNNQKTELIERAIKNE
jgi:2'-hydroxyisoflavone reductase